MDQGSPVSLFFVLPNGLNYFGFIFDKDGDQTPYLSNSE